MENREVEGLSGIASYIEEMEFKKKTLGGCDEEDVMEKIGIICDKYQEVIHRLCERQGRMEERAQKMQDEYQKKGGELLESMNQIHEYREHTLKKAEEEAAQILEEAQKKAKEEEKKIAELQTQYLREQQEYIKKTNKLREEGDFFCERVREILKQIENLEDSHKVG